jgi:hypothetical protein
MYETQNGTPSSHQQTVLWMLWGMIIGTPGVLGSVGFFLRETDMLTPTPPLTPEDLAVLTPIFASLTIAMTVAIFAGASGLAKRTNYQAYSLIRWSLCEAIGMVGFVLFLLGASWNVFCPFLGWAFLLAFYLRPTDDAHHQFRQLTGQARTKWRLHASHT